MPSEKQGKCVPKRCRKKCYKEGKKCTKKKKKKCTKKEKSPPKKRKKSVPKKRKKCQMFLSSELTLKVNTDKQDFRTGKASSNGRALACGASHPNSIQQDGMSFTLVAIKTHNSETNA